MNKNTFETYLIAIKKQYEIAKKGSYSTFLSSPTPASIRNLCVEIFKSSNSNADKEILKHFFDLKGDDTDKALIEKFDIDRLRPICHFFKGKTTAPKHDLVDLMALLINLEQRPLSKYLKNEYEEVEESKPITPENPIPEVLPKTPTEDKKTIWFKTNGLKIASGCVIMAILFLGVHYFMKGEQCMEWVNDHYEVVDCDVPNESGDRYISAKEEDSFIADFKKISPCDTLSFKDKNGNACLWYGKSLTGEMEFFNKLALHPETKKSLKEVSAHIFNTYIKDKPCE